MWHVWVVSIIEVKGGLACGGAGAVVQGELSQWQPLRPVILVVVDIHVEILSYFVVYPFDLSVHLWVVRSREILFDAKNLANVASELTHKLQAAVQYDLPGDAEVGKDLVSVDVRKLGRSQGDGGGDCNYHLGEMVHNVKDCVVALGGRERAEKVD